MNKIKLAELLKMAKVELPIEHCASSGEFLSIDEEYYRKEDILNLEVPNPVDMVEIDNLKRENEQLKDDIWRKETYYEDALLVQKEEIEQLKQDLAKSQDL